MHIKLENEKIVAVIDYIKDRKLLKLLTKEQTWIEIQKLKR